MHGHPASRKRGGGKPGTFNFLGFTHICGKTRKGAFCVLRIGEIYDPTARRPRVANMKPRHS